MRDSIQVPVFIVALFAAIVVSWAVVAAVAYCVWKGLECL